MEPASPASHCMLKLEPIPNRLMAVDVTIEKHPSKHQPRLYPGDTINLTTVRLYFHENDAAAIDHFLNKHWADAMKALWCPDGKPWLVKPEDYPDPAKTEISWGAL